MTGEVLLVNEKFHIYSFYCYYSKHEKLSVNIMRKLLKNTLPVGLVNFLRKVFVYQIFYKNSLSQCGQDSWVINEVFNGKRGGFFLEIGSADGIFINNTYFLEKRYHWSGICIEANSRYFELLKLNRDCTCLNLCIDESSKEVLFAFSDLYGGIVDEDTDNHFIENKDFEVRTISTTSLIDVLKKYKAPNIIDYFSIDVEGAETRILKNFPFKNYIFLSLTIERPGKEIHDLLIKNGYILIKFIPGLDSFYIHESFQEDYKWNVMKFHGWVK